MCGQSADLKQLPQQQNKSICRHGSSAAISLSMTHISRNSKGIKQQSFIIFHYFHTWALVVSLQTTLAPRLQLNATQAAFCKQTHFGDKAETTVTEHTDSLTQNTKTWPFDLQQHVLTAPVFMDINLINTLRTRLCLGICSQWLKMKLVNISLYTVSDIHEYREILEMGAKGVIARLVMFLLSPC